jgi:hypothetical protein
MIRDKIFTTRKLTTPKTQIYHGVEGITVELVENTKNPYKCLVEMALMTWGDVHNKWSVLSPEERFIVAKKVLQRKALPLGLESPIYLFKIWGVTRSSFDQVARQRIGSTFSSLGWNNIHTQTGFRLSNEIVNSSDHVKIEKDIEDCLRNIKTLYYDLIAQGISWQSAREIMPLGLLHWFTFSCTYAALKEFCSRRLCFSEKEDTVATAWLMRERIKEQTPFLASFLRPSCDWSKKCSYWTGDSLPEHMGSLFLPCGRNVCTVENVKPEFNLPSSDVNRIEKDLGILIPSSTEELPAVQYSELSNLDKDLFNAC